MEIETNIDIMEQRCDPVTIGSMLDTEINSQLPNQQETQQELQQEHQQELQQELHTNGSHYQIVQEPIIELVEPMPTRISTRISIENERLFDNEIDEFTETHTQKQQKTKQQTKQTTTDAIQHYIQKQFDKKKYDKYDYAETVSCLSKTETQGSELKLNVTQRNQLKENHLLALIAN